jgi:hypothetical protein
VETGLILILNAQVHNKLRTGETSSRNSEKAKVELYILLLGFHEGYGFTIHHRILASPGGG